MNNKSLFGLSETKLTALFILMILLAISTHTVRYLPTTPALFLLVFIARILVALGIGAVITLVWTFFSKIFKYQGKGYGLQTIFASASAFVAIMMTLISISNEVSEGLLLLYLN